MSEKNDKAKYGRELSAAMALYGIVLTAALMVGPGMSSGPLRTALYVSPMLPLLLALWAVVRQVRRSDEFIHKITLEHLAAAAAVTVALTTTYGFLEIAGFPRLSMFSVGPVIGAVWALLAVTESLRNR